MTDKNQKAEMTEAEAKAIHEKAIRDKNNAEMKAAKNVLKAYSQTKDFGKLADDVQAAIIRVIGKPGGGGSGSTFANDLQAMFPKVGTAIDELDIFKATKMGRGEFRKRVREVLKKADKDQRMWIEFDEATETWVLLHVGPKQPKGWLGKEID